MVFNISSLFARGVGRIDAERKDVRKEKLDKSPKTEGIEAGEKAEKAAVSRFERVGRTEHADKNKGISHRNEGKLSDKARQMLEKLRDKYGDLDIFVGNTDDELQALSQYGNKEFSVIFSNDELERMADETEYEDSRIKSMESALEEAKGIAAKLFEDGDKTQVDSFSISFSDNGVKKFFASLQRKPETGVEKVAEKGHMRRFDSYVKDSKEGVKRTTVSAASAEELLEKIKQINWDDVEKSQNGDRYNHSV